MHQQTTKTTENQSRAIANNISLQKKAGIGAELVTSQEEPVVQQQLLTPAAITYTPNPDIASKAPFKLVQPKQKAETTTISRPFKPAQLKANKTGMPDHLKTGIENLSGYSMDDVKVHYNSAQPAQLNAHAYAQGNDIHIAPGQERHLPHEAWHVVQQRQGRVKPTMQLKTGVAVNDDIGLEKEADVMGGRAVQLFPVFGKYDKKIAQYATQTKVAQLYNVANNHRIANDHTAAVEIGVNNKNFYATQQRIDESNTELDSKQMPITFARGGQQDGLVDDQVLFTVLPQFSLDKSNKNPLHGLVKPQSDALEGVKLPAECEKGAISIIGAFTKSKRSVGNQRVYDDKDHGNARIGELLSNSTAGVAQKDLWYNRWVELDDGLAIAARAFNSESYPRQNMINMLGWLLDGSLNAEFRKYFDVNDAGTHFVPNYNYSVAERSRNLLERIIRAFDDKIADLEARVMATVDTGTAGQQAELATATNLSDQLRGFFLGGNYNKAAIDQAIAMVPETAQLNELLREYFVESADHTSYNPDITFNRQAKLAAFATKVLTALSKQIHRLTARNIKSQGGGSGLNAEVNPEIGQSYGIIGGNYNMDEGGRWNWHWASVIMKTAQDNITMEAHASHRQGNETHNTRWDFKMYGTQVGSNQTFHDEWKSQGFGRAPVTVTGVVREDPALIGNATAQGLDVLTLPELDGALDAVNGLYRFVNPLANLNLSKAEMIQLYNLRQAGVAAYLAALPAAYVAANIQADYDALVNGMVDLIAGVLEEQVLADREVDVYDAAKDLMDTIIPFYLNTLKPYVIYRRRKGN